MTTRAWNRPLRALAVVLVLAGPVAAGAQPYGLGPLHRSVPQTARVVPAAAPGEPDPTGQADVIDNNTVFLFCMFGLALGIAMANFSPVADWSYYEGFPTSTWAYASRGGLGCYFGTILGVAASATRYAADQVQALWVAAVGPAEEAPPSPPPKDWPLLTE